MLARFLPACWAKCRGRDSGYVRAGCLRDCVASGVRGDVFACEKNARINISLERDARAGGATGFVERDAPIHAENIGAGFHEGREKMRRAFGVEDNGRAALANFFDHALGGGKREGFVFVSAQFACPSVEELNCSCAGLDLRVKIWGGGASDFIEEARAVNRARYRASA